jgi:glycosyltransferase involved in cell wall biosynthesis
VFLSVGAMTGNKGIDLLLRGFAAVSRAYPQARLVLKGMDPLYNSRNFLNRCMKLLSAHEQREVTDKMIYVGEALSHQDMAMLYQAADAYVSPYRAEAFNLPVLEAAACGIPIICTRGGPTDEFVTNAFARRIDSKTAVIPVDGQHASQLEPQTDHLIALMAAAIEDADWRNQASAAGPLHVAGNYTWDAAVDKLIREVLKPGAGACLASKATRNA